MAARPLPDRSQLMVLAVAAALGVFVAVYVWVRVLGG